MIVVGTAKPGISVRLGPEWGECRAEADSVPRGGFGHRQTIKHYIPAGTGAAPPPTSSSSSSSLFSSSSSPDSSCIDPGSAICQLLQAADPCHSSQWGWLTISVTLTGLLTSQNAPPSKFSVLLIFAKQSFVWSTRLLKLVPQFLQVADENNPTQKLKRSVLATKQDTE